MPVAQRASCTPTPSCVVQFLQLYAAGAIAGSAASSYFDRLHPVLGACAAVNAILLLSVFLNPTATYLIMGVVPMPAWLVGVGLVSYDMYGTTRVRSPAGSFMLETKRSSVCLV